MEEGIINVWKVLAACGLFALLILSVQTVNVKKENANVKNVNVSGFPRLDEILFKAYSEATLDAIVEDFLAGKIDWIDGPKREDLYHRVVGAGHKVLMHPSEELPSWIVVNCRDYKGGGGENWPLNDTAFRVALSYIYGVDRKAADIYNYSQAPWVRAAANFLSPGNPYYNESIQMPDTNWDAAWSMFQETGYYVEDGFLKWNGKIVHDFRVWYGAGSIFWWKVGGGFVRAFNEFMVSIGAMNSPKMTFEAVSFTKLVNELMIGHNFDFICMGLTMLTPLSCIELLREMFHSHGSWNFAGINDSRLDEFLEIWSNAMPCSPGAHWAASTFQELLVKELLPYFPVSYGCDVCTVARDERGELVGVVWTPELGYFNRLSYMMIHWKDQLGGEVKIALNTEWHNLNPFTEDTIYGWRILNTIIAPLLIEEPIHTCRRMPWIATKYEVSPWTSPPEFGVKNGAKVTFWLRQDVYWHDLKPVTAYDCVNNLRILMQYKPSKWSSVWTPLVYAEADGPYKFIAYLNTLEDVYTWVYHAADAALLIPKHVANAIERLGGNPTQWDYTRPYEELGIGPPPPQYPFLTQLVGCGPYILHYANLNNLTAHVIKFNEFFINAPSS